MTATAKLSDFIVSTKVSDLPDAAIAAVRRAAVDTVGVMLAGATEPAARIVQRVVEAEGGVPLCTVLGTRLRTHAAGAALANGVAGHAHDFDDTNFTLMGHPSAPLLAAGLAVAEAEMLAGAELALAYVVGFEVSAAIGIAVNPAHYERGWHATASIGALGCAAAAARLMGLDAARTAAALGLAASLASGLKENFGSMTKPYHAGHAAQSGVRAAQLAREGFTAAATALEGGQGYVAAFGGGRDLEGALAGLGRRWQLLESGIAVKPYPSCALTHATIDALLDLRDQERLEADQVEEIEVGVSRVVPDVLRHHRPVTGLERKFSMEFCAAAALAEGRVDLASFEAEPAPAVEKLMPRVRMRVDPTLPGGHEQHAWTRVTVRLSDGRTLASPARGARGHPDQPLSDEALRAKFVGCAAPALGPAEAEDVAALIARLDEVPDVRALTARLGDRRA